MHPRHIFSMPEHSLIYIKRFEGELSSKVANVYLEFRRCKAKSEGLSFKLFLCCALVVLRAEIRDVFRLLLLFCSIWCHPSVRISSWKTEIRLESLEIALFQAFSHFRLCRPHLHTTSNCKAVSASSLCCWLLVWVISSANVWWNVKISPGSFLAWDVNYIPSALPLRLGYITMGIKHFWGLFLLHRTHIQERRRTFRRKRLENRRN